MNDFNDIKANWAQRDIPAPPINGHREAIKKASYIKKRQQLGQAILVVTVIMLLAFFYHVSAMKNTRLTGGLCLMIGSLLLRIGVEFFSNAQLKSFTPTLQAEEFGRKISAYYRSRFFIHTLLTPFLFIGYIIGFLILLPSFKANLSAGFYSYILFSAGASFVFLALLILIQTRKELQMIRQMKMDTDNTSKADKPNTVS